MLDQGYANQSQDFTPVVLAIKQSGADILGSYFTFENDLGIFARQLRQLGVNIPWVGSPSIVQCHRTEAGRSGAVRHLWRGRLRRRFQRGFEGVRQAYRDAVKVAPDNQSSWPYDAVTVLAAAINKAGSTDPTKIREAILAIKKFPGAEGEYNFDQNGDGLHGYNIVKNEKGNDRLRQAHRVQRLMRCGSPERGCSAFFDRASADDRLRLSEFCSGIGLPLNRACPWISHYNCCLPESASARSMRWSRSVSC